MQKLVAEEILTFADIGLRGERSDGVLTAKFAREAAFARPDRQQDVAGNANFSLDPRQRVAVFRGEFPSAGSERLERRLAQILRRRLYEFRLLRLLLGLSRNREVGK